MLPALHPVGNAAEGFVDLGEDARLFALAFLPVLIRHLARVPGALPDELDDLLSFGLGSMNRTGPVCVRALRILGR